MSCKAISSPLASSQSWHNINHADILNHINSRVFIEKGCVCSIEFRYRAYIDIIFFLLDTCHKLFVEWGVPEDSKTSFLLERKYKNY